MKDKFYGCGNPLPAGIEGLRVLDLGCGSGRDCYVAASLVGERGSVIGERSCCCRGSSRSRSQGSHSRYRSCFSPAHGVVWGPAAAPVPQQRARA